MPKASIETASKTNDFGVGIDHTEEFGEYTMNFVTIRQDIDLTPMLRGLPNDSCQCPHWGYMLKGRMTVRYADRDEVIEPGDSFYLPPGHVPAASGGSEFVQFSPTDDLRESEEQMARNMAAMQGSDSGDA